MTKKGMIIQFQILVRLNMMIHTDDITVMLPVLQVNFHDGIRATRHEI
jgi:hypothetical protein